MRPLLLAPTPKGLSRKKLIGYGPGALAAGRTRAQGLKVLPNIRQTYSWFVAIVLAKDPAAPFCRLVMKPVDWYPDPAAIAPSEPRAPKAASKMGNGAWPGRPIFWKLLTPAA